MAWGVRWYRVGSIILGLLGVLAGCSGGGFFAEREPWRHEAEVQCLNMGAVKESAGIVRIRPIRGPGMCGADFPLKVSTLGESGPLEPKQLPRLFTPTTKNRCVSTGLPGPIMLSHQPMLSGSSA